MNLAEQIKIFLFSLTIHDQVLVLLKEGDFHSLVSFAKEHFPKLTDPEDRKAVVRAIIEKGDSNSLLSLAKEHFSKWMDPENRKAIVRAILKNKDSSCIAAFLGDHLAELTDEEFRMVTKAADPNLLVSFVKSHAESFLLFFGDSLRHFDDEELFGEKGFAEIMKMKKNAPACAESFLRCYYSEEQTRVFNKCVTILLETIERVDSHHLVFDLLDLFPFTLLSPNVYDHVVNEAVKRADPAHLVSFLRENPRRNRLDPQHLQDLIDAVINRADPDLLVPFTEDYFAELTDEQRTNIVRMMAAKAKANSTTLTKFLLVFFPKLTAEDRMILLPAVREKANPKRLFEFWQCYTQQLKENPSWFHMVMERSDFDKMAEYVKGDLQDLTPASLRLMEAETSCSILPAAIRFHTFSQLGEEWLHVVVEKVHSKELGKFLGSYLSNMDKEEFCILIEKADLHTVFQLLQKSVLISEKFQIALAKMIPYWDDRFRKEYCPGQLTQAQIEISAELDVVISFLQEHVSKLTKTEADAIFFFLKKHCVQRANKLLEEIATKAEVYETVSTSKRRTWGRRANDGCNY
jgi:succinate dehydrogenase flavin-adding protein (antitoxin of CptAB toxin-antitoxin module)